jgi:hypothetical protein
VKKFILAAALVSGALVVPAAQASHANYTGGCRFATVNDTTPDGTLGGQNTWNGQVNVVVVATDPATGAPTPANITATCEIQVNGVGQGVALTATGIGFAANAGTLQYVSADGDVVEVCTEVTLDSDPPVRTCVTATRTQIVPQPVIDALILVIDTLDALLVQIFDLINSILIGLDPTICTNLLVPLGPGVAGVVDILPDGDVYILGEFIWDCPPYVEG